MSNLNDCTHIKKWLLVCGIVAGLVIVSITIGSIIGG